MWDRIRDSDVGSDGKQRGLEALQTVYAAETAWGHGALSGCACRWVIMGTMPWSD